MTKLELLKILSDCDDNARIAIVQADGFVKDITEAVVFKARPGLLKNDEAQLFYKPRP